MDLMTKLLVKMLARTQKSLTQGMHEAMSEVLDEMIKGALNQAKLAELIRKMGIDPAQFSGTIGGVPGVDAYQILGLDRSASDEAIKKRYRELLQYLHPDTAGCEGTSLLLQMVLAAYELIKKARGWQGTES